MSALWLLLTWLAASSFYLGCAHQRMWNVDPATSRWLRIGGWVGAVLATVAAVVALGRWPGIFAAMTSLMLALVALPYIDAWRQRRKQPASCRPSRLSR